MLQLVLLAIEVEQTTGGLATCTRDGVQVQLGPLLMRPAYRADFPSAHLHFKLDHEVLKCPSHRYAGIAQAKACCREMGSRRKFSVSDKWRRELRSSDRFRIALPMQFSQELLVGEPMPATQEFEKRVFHLVFDAGLVILELRGISNQ